MAHVPTVKATGAVHTAKVMTLYSVSVGAEGAKKLLREARGRTDAMIALAEEGPSGLLQTLDALLPSLTVPGACIAPHDMSGCGMITKMACHNVM